MPLTNFLGGGRRGVDGLADGTIWVVEIATLLREKQGKQNETSHALRDRKTGEGIKYHEWNYLRLRKNGKKEDRRQT